jgi:carbonic anhydrase/acetyltransferase-like protein (isoleucine patch superfamily)
MGAVILDGAVIGERTIVGAHSLVPQSFECPLARWSTAPRPVLSGLSQRTSRKASASGRKSMSWLRPPMPHEQGQPSAPG